MLKQKGFLSHQLEKNYQRNSRNVFKNIVLKYFGFNAQRSSFKSPLLHGIHLTSGWSCDDSCIEDIL